MRLMPRFALLLSLVLWLSTGQSQTFVYDFSAGDDGWIGDFADYPVIDSLSYELACDWTRLPVPLDTTKHALRITGNNHSDDLFMFIKKRISGLLPNTTYQLITDVCLASTYPTKHVGIGGAPGEGVVVKVGASIVEPAKTAQNGYYRMNIDKGGQTNPGADMDTVGHVGVTDTTTVYTLIERSNATHPFVITTDSHGDVWVCIGTDSGFEGTSTLYYNQIKVTFTLTSGIIDDHTQPDGFLLRQNYPNPFNPSTTIAYALGRRSSVTLKVFNLLGQEVTTLVDEVQQEGEKSVTFDASGLPSGIYLSRLVAGTFVQTRKLVLIR